MPPNLEDENSLWGSQGNVYPKAGSQPNKTLNYYFPELVKAGGQVDPTEAVVALLAKVKELEAKLNGLDSGTTPSPN